MAFDSVGIGTVRVRESAQPDIDVVDRNVGDANVLDRSAARRIRLHVAESCRVHDMAVMHPDVAYAARKLRPASYERMTVEDAAVAHLEVLRRAPYAPSVAVAPRLDRDNVVALVEADVLDEHVASPLRINAVCVVAVRTPRQVAADDVFATDKIKAPERAVLPTNTLDKDVRRAVELDEMRP